MVVDLGSDANFLELDDVLIFPGFSLFPALLVTEFPVIHEPAHRWHRVRCNLDKIEATVTRHLECLERGNDAYLLTLLIDQPDFANPDALVDSGLDRSGNNLPPLPAMRDFCS